MVVRVEAISDGLLTISHLKQSISMLVSVYGKHWQDIAEARKGVEERKTPLEVEIVEPGNLESGKKQVIYYLTVSAASARRLDKDGDMGFAVRLEKLEPEWAGGKLLMKTRWRSAEGL